MSYTATCAVTDNGHDRTVLARTFVSTQSNGRQLLKRLEHLTIAIAMLFASVTAAVGGVADPRHFNTREGVAQRLLATNPRARPARAAVPDPVSVRDALGRTLVGSIPQRLDAPRTRSTVVREFGSRNGGSPAPDLESRLAQTLAIRWQTTPEWVRTVRSYRRAGLPLVHLWESTDALVAIGVNRHGVPGIYLTRKLPN
jgi:hypothetical protein